MKKVLEYRPIIAFSAGAIWWASNFVGQVNRIEQHLEWLDKRVDSLKK